MKEGIIIRSTDGPEWKRSYLRVLQSMVKDYDITLHSFEEWKVFGRSYKDVVCFKEIVFVGLVDVD